MSIWMNRKRPTYPGVYQVDNYCKLQIIYLWPTHRKFQFSVPLKGLSFARVLGKEDGVETGIGHLLTAPGSQSPCVLLRIPVVLVPV